MDERDTVGHSWAAQRLADNATESSAATPEKEAVNALANNPLIGEPTPAYLAHHAGHAGCVVHLPSAVIRMLLTGTRVSSMWRASASMPEKALTAYKFTNLNRTSKYGITDYPEIGKWSETRTPILCKSGWHVPVLLSEWIAPELWKVRVRGLSVGDIKKRAYEQILFVEKVEDWNKATMIDFIIYCCQKPADAYAYASADAYADVYAYAAAYADASAAPYAYTAADAAASAARRYQHNWLIGKLNLGKFMEVPE